MLITSGVKPCFIAGTACRNRKLPPPWPASKMIPRLRASNTNGRTLPCSSTIRNPSVHVGVHVGHDVARPQVLEQQVFERERGRVVAEVDHHRHVHGGSRLDRTLDRIPFSARIMRDLDPDDRGRVLLDPHRGEPRVHVAEVLLDRAALHARADDVDEGEHAGAGAIDDLFLELREVPPSRSARRRPAWSGRCGTSARPAAPRCRRCSDTHLSPFQRTRERGCR